MVKRILLTSLLLFLPLFANADVLVIGEDVRARNIPFKVDVMEKAFKDAFADASNYETIRGNFYSAVYNAPLPMPFSMQDLHEVCQNSVPKLAKKTNLSRCADLVRIYIDEIVKDSEKSEDTKEDTQKVNKVSTEKFIKTLREYNESYKGVTDSIIPIIKDYLADSVDVNVPVYEDGHTALMIAVNKGDDDLARLLLDANANVNAITKTGKTALYIAVASGNLKMTDLLLQAGADSNVRMVNEMLPTVLFIALDDENIEIIDLLVRISADTKVFNIKHETPCDFLHHTKKPGEWADFDYADYLLCGNIKAPRANSSNSNTAKAQTVKTCDITDPDDVNFTLCCIAQDEGVAQWDPYARVCHCLDSKKVWDKNFGNCLYNRPVSCEERYSNHLEAIHCCYGEEKGESKWNDITSQCVCYGTNKIWNGNQYECVEVKK